MSAFRFVFALIYFWSAACFAYSPNNWKADYFQLRKQISDSYANLEWIEENRKINLPELDRLTLQRLDQAKTDPEAFRALFQFVSAFGDGHLVFDPKTYERFAPITEYPFEIRETEKKFYLAKIDSPNCSLTVGDELTKIEGQTVADRVEENTNFLSESNPITKHQRAIRRLWRSPFLPEKQQTIEGIHAGKIFFCELKPLPFKSVVQKNVSPPNKTMTAEVACRSMGFEAGNHDFKFALGSAQILSPDGASFPTAILTTSNGKKIGLVRISSFREEEFLDLCLAEWEKFRMACGKECQQQFLEKRISPRLLSELTDAIEKLKTEMVSAVVVDLTFNGGGSSWGDKAAALFTKKIFVCDAFGLIRHPKWTIELKNKSKKLKNVLRHPSLSPLQKAIAKKELKHIESLMAESKRKCNRDSVWKKDKPSLTCNLLIKDQNPLCGRDEEILAQAYEGVRIDSRVPSQGSGVYEGQLYVLTNSFSASESESFTKLLKEAGAAKVIGEATMGIGCGFATDSKPIPLKHSGIALEIPDCQRFFQNGESELLGIQPDIPLRVIDLNDLNFVRSLSNSGVGEI